MLLGRLVVRELHNRPGRAALTLLSVVIGVAAILSVAMVAAITRRTYADTYRSVAGPAALEVSAEGDGGFDAQWAASLEEIHGVRAALPLVERPTVLYAKGKRLPLRVLGIDPQRDEATCDYELEQGRLDLGQRQGVLAADFARGLGIAPGDEVRILSRLGVRKIRVSGVLARKGATVLRQSAVMLLSLHDAQTLVGAKGRIDRIHLILQDGANETLVAGEVARRLPPGLSVGRPRNEGQLVAEVLAVVEQALSLAGSLSLLLAGVVIGNTFLMNLTERRSQVGILRAIGATRRQIARLFLAEGLLLGIAGTILGIPLGLGGTYLLSRALEQALGVSLPASHPSGWPYAVAVFLGVSVSVLAACLPARKASRVSPLEAIGGAVAEETERISLAIPAAAAVVLTLFGVLLAGMSCGWISIQALRLADLFLLFGLALLIPILVGPASGGLEKVLSPLARLETRLARRQIMRRRTRASLTVSVLFVAMAFACSIGGTALNVSRDIRDWGRRAIVGDFYIWAALPDAASGQAVTMSQRLRDHIARIPTVGNVDTVRYLLGRSGDQSILVVAREFTAPGYLPLDLREGDAAAARRQLEDGQAVIGIALAERLQIEVGGQLPVETPGGTRSIKVAGIANDYTASGMTVYLHRDAAKRLLDLEGVDAFVIDSRPEMHGRAEGELRAFCDEHGLLFQSVTELRNVVDTMISGFLACLWLLLVLGFIVAAFGICNTLTMDILERTREIGLLRIVGMTRAQVRRMILVQTLMMALLGVVPGVCVGMFFSWLANLSALALLGHPIAMAVDPLWLAACVVGAVAIAMGAALLPAVRAGGLDLRNALQYE